MQDLINRAKHDPEAFREVYRQFFPRVYGYVAGRVGQRADVEDVVADVFLAVVESLDRFEYRGTGSFAAWIFRIAHNRINQFYRNTPGDSAALDDLPDIAGDDSPPENALLRRERFARLHACIAQLSPRRQEVITLRFFGGLRNQEIATVLGLDERTVASHLCRALEDLEREYQQEEASHE